MWTMTSILYQARSKITSCQAEAHAWKKKKRGIKAQKVFAFFRTAWMFYSMQLFPIMHMHKPGCGPVQQLLKGKNAIYINKMMYHAGLGLMIGVFILELGRSGLSNSPNKACMVRVILPIVITWSKINKPVPGAPFFFIQQK